MIELVHKFRKERDVIFLFAFTLILFPLLIKYVSTDITAHIQHSININSTTTSYPANFLFYFVLNLLSGFSSNRVFLYLIAIVLLALATVAKYVISRNMIARWNGIKRNEVGYNYKIYLIAFGLFFCFAIPDFHFFMNQMYLGKIVPMVWHNSTTIVLFPFAILLYKKQLLLFNQISKIAIVDIAIVNLLVLINVLIKPSFLFVYLPVTTVFLITRLRSEASKTVLLKLSPVITGVIFIFIQYYFIYSLQLGSIQKEISAVFVSSPFEFLSHWIPAWLIPISLFLSFTLPIFSMILYKDIFRYKPFIYALSLTIVGILISAFIMESGPRMLHGNFTWQNVICCYILFLATVSFLTPKFLNKEWRSKKVYVLIFLFAIHALSGILYLVKIGITSNYI